MSDQYPLCRLALVLALLGGALAGCSSVPDVSRVADVVKPYQIDRVQGNVVTREQVAVLKPGMPKRLVQEILGTPLLTSVFHADRWDYVFSLLRQGAEPQMRRVSVFFKDDVLTRFEADDLPSEAEFVATLKSMQKLEKLPAMQAPPEVLEKFSSTAKAVKPAPAATPEATGAAASYPPLEPPSR